MTEILNAVLDLLSRMLSDDARVRERAADESVDMIQSLQLLGPVVAGVLVTSRLVEHDHDAQEAQLHALAELHEWGLVTKEARELLCRIDLRSVDARQVEYLGYLLDGE